MVTKVITGVTLPVLGAVIFYLTGVPAWAWLYLVAIVAIEAAMVARAHRYTR
jgi:hypothetical protein